MQNENETNRLTNRYISSVEHVTFVPKRGQHGGEAGALRPFAHAQWSLNYYWTILCVKWNALSIINKHNECYQRTKI